MPITYSLQWNTLKEDDSDSIAIHFKFLGDLGQLLKGVMAEAKNLTNAERCSLFLIDKYTGELVSKVFDGNEVSVWNEEAVDGFP